MQKSNWSSKAPLRYTRHPALKNTRKRHNRKILLVVSVEEYASTLLVSKVTAGLVTDNKQSKSQRWYGHARLTSRQPSCMYVCVCVFM